MAARALVWSFDSTLLDAAENMVLNNESMLEALQFMARRLLNFSNRVRLSLEGSSLRPAESRSSSRGLHVRLRLLSTPPRGDAVTFGFRERASPGRGLVPLCVHQLPGAPRAASSLDETGGSLRKSRQEAAPTEVLSEGVS
jgi:hypothetical protein